MSTNAWLDDNSRYLAASLHWLRLRLQRLATPVEMSVRPTITSVETAGRTWFGRGASNAGLLQSFADPVTNAPNPTHATSDTAALAQAAQEREAAAACDPAPALLLLAQRLGLSVFERDTLLLCAAVELDPSMPALLGAAQNVATKNFPSFALALQLFDEPSWDALSPHRPLRYLRVVDINQPGATPLTAAALRADERIVNYLKGLNALDERLSSLLTPVIEAAPPALAPSQQGKAEDVLRRLEASASDAPLPLVQLLGVDGGSKLALAREICSLLERRLYRIGLETLPTQKSEIDNLARLWQRESALLPIALYLDAESLDSAPTDVASAYHWFVSRELGLVFAGLREAPGQGGPVLAIEVGKPSAAEQVEAWRQVLPPDALEDPRLAQRLAGQFNLNLHDIHRAAANVHDIGGANDVAPRLWDACRRITLPRLDVLAQRLEPKATWDDLVLSDESFRLLQQIVGQVRERYTVYEDWGYARKMTRGLGINALFAGESGTGKTMAAEVLANELQLALYRIDLSAVVSKYIGETEKNLRRLFDAAEAGGAILLFDEADALFGKRSEVKDSHDRYANIEINYLLQRMEAFSGLALLATNMKSALDSAFLRRLRFVVNFSFPGPAERRRIWQRALPPEVPRETLDYDRLARFGLSGGNIHSIALNAAFSAAQRGTPVSQALLQTAVRTELRKLDKPVNEAEFR
jgi:hypothetical protein